MPKRKTKKEILDITAMPEYGRVVYLNCLLDRAEEKLAHALEKKLKGVVIPT